ncbi:response regulator transcription factor [Pigmentiphaga aceris]|uniref:Response regulator transcription factor n=1 Tax=Pigmentiphaga aceris TaxID=1940612 RepID=A0A5C0B216_9BURK|nr:response regulator transcription factor [Pigmentiphaga aceris]QEI07210.1 response regulator transcription factor [Pigmentiphaga aceris]
MIRLVIVDDHAIVRSGLRQIAQAETDINVVGEAADSGELLDVLRKQDSDVVLMDISMPGKNGLDALKLVKERWPTTAVLMLSMYPEDQYAVRSVKAGASGYLHKNSPPETVIQAIRTVAKGKKFITPELAEQLATHIGQDADQPLHERLSDREYQTMSMIASGHTLSQIAEQMSLSPKTVSVYRARLLEKMRLKNNAELTHYALKHKLVE